MRDLSFLARHGTSAYRAVVGFLMACHGASSLFGFPVSGPTVSPGHWPGGVAAVLQFTFGFLVMVGLWTRTSAVVLSGAMAFAYFSVHQEKALLPMANGGEPAALYSWAFLAIALIGPGPLALDALMSRVRDAGGPAPRAAVAD
jgi:putative oxidoreductase